MELKGSQRNQTTVRCHPLSWLSWARNAYGRNAYGRIAYGRNAEWSTKMKNILHFLAYLVSFTCFSRVDSTGHSSFPFTPWSAWYWVHGAPRSTSKPKALGREPSFPLAACNPLINNSHLENNLTVYLHFPHEHATVARKEWNCTCKHW